MKTLRLITVMVAAILLFSVWGPTPAYASPAGGQPATGAASVIDAGKTKLGSLTVNNRTGGTMSVRLTGAGSYFFSTSKQGSTTFKEIKPGKYTIVVTTSGCGGSMTFKRNIKGNAHIPALICRHH